MSQKISTALVDWYLKNSRPLPWRRNKDPYRIWISEIMLQQTTVTAVVPYFEKFINRFPNVHELAQAPISEVIKYWSGLGYYSRARNLHKASQILSKTTFANTWSELIKLPGFGPYTSRAVSSLAFGEKVGVIDGNVIRVLSRFYNQKIEWWAPKGRSILQHQVDLLVENVDSSHFNQAIMELGATICTPKSPACTLCPWIKSCKGLKAMSINDLPIRKPKRQNEIWVWRPSIILSKNRIWLHENKSMPFLKGHLLPPGPAHLEKAKPKHSDVSHMITHHKIFVQLKIDSRPTKANGGQWINIDELSEYSPTSLMKKILKKAFLTLEKK